MTKVQHVILWQSCVFRQVLSKYNSLNIQNLMKKYCVIDKYSLNIYHFSKIQFRGSKKKEKYGKQQILGFLQVSCHILHWSERDRQRHLQHCLTRTIFLSLSLRSNNLKSIKNAYYIPRPLEWEMSQITCNCHPRRSRGCQT